MKILVQSQKDYLQSINRLEVQMSHLVNTGNDKNEKTLPNILLTIPDSPSHIDRNRESWCFENKFNQDSILSHQLNLTNSKPLTNWQLFTLIKLNLIMNVTSISNFVIQFQFLNLY